MLTKNNNITDQMFHSFLMRIGKKSLYLGHQIDKI